jgi:hypothetical protein
MSDEELLFIYGKHAVLSRKGSFVLVHLDGPSAELVQARTDAFEPDEFFSPGCGMCQMLKDGGVIVFNDAIFEDDVLD